MAGRVIDELVTIIRYNTSNRELRRAEQQVNDFTRNTQRQFASWGQTISKITRAATVVMGALGAGAFKVGAAEERSLLNLRTQLGLAADEVERDQYGTTVEELGKSLQFTTAVVVQRNRILRTRARFNDWSCTFVLDVDEELIDATQLGSWLDIAGRRIGLGDWRPEKSGDYGRFEAVSIETANEDPA